ncbi:hypothetical protein BS627_23645 [Agrobacterium salinitolerans]|nr:hypothetical protein BS627_23645 [Agrobacterium salinitolerans]PNQ19891.1 hypothetical protein C2E26_24015 [Rhizobium sp. YIC5082]
MATKGRSDFRLRQEVLGRRSGKANSNAPIFTAHDLLFFNGRDLTSMPLSSRRHLLEEFLHIKVLGIMFSEAIDADGEHYSLPSANSVSKASSQRIEAVTIAPAAWGDWLKNKCAQSGSVFIVGYDSSSSPVGGIGTLLLAANNADEIAYADSVGTGFRKRRPPISASPSTG